MNAQLPTQLPTLIRVEDLAQLLGLSLQQAYDAARCLPNGVVMRIGTRIRIDAARLTEWLAEGGSATLPKPRDPDIEPSTFASATPARKQRRQPPPPGRPNPKATCRL